MTGSDPASGVPRVWDVILDGYGYVLDRTWDGNSLRHPPTSFKYSPTFVERQNVGNAYGDNQQDFWLTETQKDWSLGESRAFYDPEDPVGSRMFSSSLGVDVSVEGQLTLAGLLTSQANSASFASSVSGNTGWYTLSDSHLWNLAGSDLGAHGLGTATMTVYGMCQDSSSLYMASVSAGTVGVRKYKIATTTFSTFSATPSDSIAYLNNALYGAVNSTSVLQVYSTAGAATTLYTWQDAAGAARAQTFKRLLAFGGSLLILIQPTYDRGELWLYNGTSTYMIARLPPNFEPYDMTETEGVVFISGMHHTGNRTPADRYVPAIFTYLNGNLDQLWPTNTYIDATGITGGSSQYPPAMAGWHNWLIFTTQTDVMRYDLLSGAICSLGAATVGPFSQIVTSATTFGVFSSTTETLYAPGRAATTGSVVHSAFDFSSSLQKYIRGVSVTWVGVGGTTTSVDIAWTTDAGGSGSQVGAVSGTEYPINLSARSVTITLTMHGSGASIYGSPTISRLFVRAAPVLNTYRYDTFILDLSGSSPAAAMGEPAMNPVRLRDGSYQTLTGAEMAVNLRAAVTATSPISITDRFGTFTGIIEADSFVLEEVSPGEFRAFVTVREV